jgi:hypothetical protein
MKSSEEHDGDGDTVCDCLGEYLLEPQDGDREVAIPV